MPASELDDAERPTLPARQKVWLVTGASAGLGLCVAISALRAGHHVIASTTNSLRAAQVCPQLEALGGRWVGLDFSIPNAARGLNRTIKDVIKEVGSIDVLVNNVGIVGCFGVMEDISEAEFRRVMDVNFYGPMTVLRAVLPSMRAQRSGTVIQISSTSGFVGSPAVTPYCASKFAMEGLSESLAQEVASFNIRVVIVEPGMFHTTIMSKTSWVDSSASEYVQDPAARRNIEWIEKAKSKLGAPDKVGGDPEKFGDRIVELVDLKGLAAAPGVAQLLRVPLGTDSWGMYRCRGQQMVEESAIDEQIARSTDF